MYRLFSLTWKKLVDPSVTIGERTSLLETTCIRKTSAIERLQKQIYSFNGSLDSKRQWVAHLRSVRYSLEMST